MNFGFLIYIYIVEVTYDFTLCDTMSSISLQTIAEALDYFGVAKHPLEAIICNNVSHSDQRCGC